MTTAESYGRWPVPADKWVRVTLETALEEARQSLADAEQNETVANAAATKAIEMNLLWRGRVEHLEAALAAMEAAPAPAAEPRQPDPVPPVCGACGAAHWMNVVCSSPGGPVSWPLHDEGGGQ